MFYISKKVNNKIRARKNNFYHNKSWLVLDYLHKFVGLEMDFYEIEIFISIKLIVII